MAHRYRRLLTVSILGLPGAIGSLLGGVTPLRWIAWAAVHGTTDCRCSTKIQGFATSPVPRIWPDRLPAAFQAPSQPSSACRADGQDPTVDDAWNRFVTSM
jgi:hypothetical protein